MNLGQPEQARALYEESIAIYRPLAAANPAFKEDLERSLNNLEELNRKEGIRSGALTPVPANALTYLPTNDPNTPLRRSVLRLWPTFAGKASGIGQLGTAFVVKRLGDRAWIITARHVVHASDDDRPAIKVEAELYAGLLPAGLVTPRLEVLLPPQAPPADGADDLIVLEVRGLPPDVQPLPLAAQPPAGPLTVVGHPSEQPPWTVARFGMLKLLERQVVLDGRLNEGASGSPVLNGAGQVVGLVFESGVAAGGSFQFVSAYRTAAIQAMIP